MGGEVTKREVLFSIVIICFMLTIGFVISGKIDNYLMDKYEEYNTALQIDDDSNLFAYAMQTNVGRAFVYGNLIAVDTVNYPEVGGEYSYIQKVEEHYNMHTRTVTRTRTVNGKTQTYTTTEVYWSWDPERSWSEQSKVIAFLGIEFPYDTIRFPGARYIETIEQSTHVRFVYYGSPAHCKGTIYTNFKDNTISDTDYFDGRNIEETISSLESGGELIEFWIGWILLMGGVVVWFYMKENDWLENH